jgi:hypothetical protein
MSQARTVQIPKLIVRVRFPSPAPVMKMQVIPEGAGRCQEGPACSFAVVLAFAGHGSMAARLLSLIAAISRELAVRVKDRALWAWPRLRGAAGVLEALAGEPIMAGQGKAAGLRRGALCDCVPAPRCSLVAGQAPGCGHPFGVPAVAGRGAWGGPRRAAGSIRGTAAPPGGGGQTCGRSRAARVRACSPGLLRAAAGGQ